MASIVHYPIKTPPRVFYCALPTFFYCAFCCTGKKKLKSNLFYNSSPYGARVMKKASKRNLHIVKTSCRSMKAIIFRVFDHFANSPTNLLDLNLPKMGRKLKQSLFQHVNVMFLQGKFCVSACVGKSFAKCLLSEFCIL